jgi:ABC-type dipeptide/oligopeptide/nickel transport system permease subunit
VRQTSPLRHSLGELLTCPFCLDVWVTTAFVIGLIFVPRIARLVAGAFTALTAADFLQLAYATAQQSAER